MRKKMNLRQFVAAVAATVLLLSCSQNPSISTTEGSPGELATLSAPAVTQITSPIETSSSDLAAEIQLTFVNLSGEGKTSRIYAIDIGCLDQAEPCIGGQAVLVPINYPLVIRSVDWSPDGTTAAITGLMHGKTDVFLLGLDGQKLTRVTDDERQQLSTVWSPDGAKLAYVSCEYLGCSLDLFDVRAGDTETVRDFDTEMIIEDWSPTSDIVTVDGYLAGLRRQIFLMNPFTGNEMLQITDGETDSFAAVFSPLGNKIIYSGFTRSNQYTAFIYDLETKYREEIYVEGMVFAQWGSHPNWLVLFIGSATERDIYLMNIETQELFNITNKPARYAYLAWRILP